MYQKHCNTYIKHLHNSQFDATTPRFQKISILFGGCSSEHEVSLHSAYSMITHLNQEKYEPVLIGITREGKWLLFQDEVELIEQVAAWCGTITNEFFSRLGSRLERMEK